MRDNSSHLVIIFLLTLITVNLFILDLKVFSPSSAVKLSDVSSAVSPMPTPTNNPNSILPQNLICPNSCINIIEQATGSAIPTTGNTVQSVSAQREFYIPLGSGTTSKSDWDNIIGTETLIDPGNYGRVKEAYFVASLNNPTQNGAVEAQLYNVTDKHLVWDSHVVMNGSLSQTITSNKITLDTGSKLYRVQLKSTLGFSVSLENAKIRIVTQ